MKKIIPIIALLLAVFVSCENVNINGGRYYGTFHNLTNDMRGAGNVSFKYVNSGGIVYFMMNELVSMGQVAENKYVGEADGVALEDLLKTMPAINAIQVCDSLETIRLMSVDAEFKGNSVKANMTFTTSTDKVVDVEFIGSYE